MMFEILNSEAAHSRPPRRESRARQKEQPVQRPRGTMWGSFRDQREFVWKQAVRYEAAEMGGATAHRVLVIRLGAEPGASARGAGGALGVGEGRCSAGALCSRD